MPEPVSPPPELEVIGDPRRAAALMHPIRLRILHQASQPTSATQAAGRLGLTRQRVNHHFRQLIASGFLRPAGRRRKRNMVEKLYVASAMGYLISPQILGPARADWRAIPSTQSAAYLLALLGDAQMDLARAGGASDSLPAETISLKTQFRLRNAKEREELARALRDSLADVVVRHTGPPDREDGEPAPGRLHRLILACYPHVSAPGAGAE